MPTRVIDDRSAEPWEKKKTCSYETIKTNTLRNCTVHIIRNANFIIIYCMHAMKADTTILYDQGCFFLMQISNYDNYAACDCKSNQLHIVDL